MVRPTFLAILFRVSLLFASGALATESPAVDSIPDPDGHLHAVWHGWGAKPQGLNWSKQQGQPWILSSNSKWSLGRRVWQEADSRIPLWEHLWGRRGRYLSVIALPKNSTDPLPLLDSNRYWRCVPSLLDTVTPFRLPGAGRIHWTGRYFWASPESLWAEGKLECKRSSSVPVEALLPSGLADQTQSVTAFRPRFLRIGLEDELDLPHGKLRSSRPMLLVGPPEKTVPWAFAMGRKEEEEEDPDAPQSPSNSPRSLLLHVDKKGYHGVESISWLPKLGIHAKSESLQILSRQNGVTFSVDPVTPNLSPLPFLSDSTWQTRFRPDGANDDPLWTAGEPGSGRLIELQGPGHAFLDAFVTAWNEHRAVRLSPDAVWMLLLEGLLTVVRENPDSVRREMVFHDTGKVRLDAKLGEDFPSQMDRCEAWEEVASQLLDSMDRHTVGHRERNLHPQFSTTTPTRALAAKIRILELYQDYFDYSGSVGCGIPSIHLEGTPTDWKQLRSQVKSLFIRSTRTWLEGLIPVLDQFVAASEGKPNAAFWTAFVRFRPAGHDCGDVDQLDGWITRLVQRPAIESDDSTNLAPRWEERLWLQRLQNDHGSLPFVLREGREKRSFQFVSGFSGVRQDPDGALAPELGWAVWEIERETPSADGQP